MNDKVRKISRTGQKRYAEILRIIFKYNVEKGWPPTIREITDRSDLKSTSNIQYWMNKMETDGLIKRGEYDSPRAIAITARGFEFLKPE